MTHPGMETTAGYCCDFLLLEPINQGLSGPSKAQGSNRHALLLAGERSERAPSSLADRERSPMLMSIGPSEI